MNGTKCIVGGVVIASIISIIVLFGYAHMEWIGNHRQDLRNLLAPNGEVLVQDAAIVAWEPDANYKPQAYYLVRSLEEAIFRRLAKQANLTVVPSPEVAEGVWQLPAGLKLHGWTPQDVPPSAGLQASGTVGTAAVWLRWYRGKMFLVALPSSP